MNYKNKYFFCSEKLITHIPEIDELLSVLKSIEWFPEFSFNDFKTGKQYWHQSAYNYAFKKEFVNKRSWENQPLLHTDPRLIGDFRKNDIFVEVQFGNSSTLYRDYYKFHYGLMHGLLSLAVLITPCKPEKFFPTRTKSVQNMASFELAAKYFELLPIPVPILLVGLKADED